MEKEKEKEKEEALAEYETLRAGYIALLNDLDMMENWGKTQLEALYASKIGIFQIEVLKVQLSIKALKRKVEYLHSCINREIEPDFLTLELMIAEELANAEREIMQQAEDIEKSKVILSNLASPERSNELRKLFKNMAKILHPDVNPDATVEQVELWHKVRDAYESGDLERLKAIELVYEKELGKAEERNNELSLEVLLLRNLSMKEGIRILEEKRKHLNSTFPFVVRHLIKDETWVEEQQAQLKEQLNSLRQQEERLSEEYHHLKRIYE